MIVAARQTDRFLSDIGKDKSGIRMKLFSVIARVFFFALLAVAAGCQPAPPTPPIQPTVNGTVPDELTIYTCYVPAKIDIIPLTEFVSVGGAQNASKIKVYVRLLDSFGCQIKSPGTFRFEIYNHVPRSAKPKGRRITIWPDIDLTDPIENNNYWRDYFRAYEFELDFSPRSDQCYVLEATCRCPNGRRLSADFLLKYANR
jgi:hypothetical protein